jgi:hypothetical protein
LDNVQFQQDEIHRREMLRKSALTKLTQEEREALGI